MNSPIQLVSQSGDLPCPRSEHTGSILENRLYIFGGEDATNTRFNDLYTLNFDTLIWEKIQTQDGPEKRSSATMVTWENNLYIFGGYFNHQESNELWKYSPLENKWSLIKTNYIKGRHFHSVTLISDKMYVYGGHGGEYGLNDFDYFDFIKNEWKKVEQLKEEKERFAHKSCQYQGNLYIYGGFTNELLNTEFIYFNFKTKSWNQLLQFGERPIFSASNNLLESNDYFYIIDYNNDVFQYSTYTKFWKRYLNISSKLHLFGWISIKYRNDIYLHGGYSNRSQKAYNHLISFKTSFVILKVKIINEFSDVEFIFAKPKRKRNEDDELSSKKRKEENEFHLE